MALPALLANGLLKHTAKHFSLASGYYNIESIFLLLGFMALARIKTIENLRYCAPGEWGKLLGLDRIPEVRTMREKIKKLTYNDQAKSWSVRLSKEWMEQYATEQIGVFHVDGHVREYYGAQTKLPRHYVARQRLCLRATVDYWVNALDGQPFFLVNKAVDPGLLEVLRKDIVPRLKKEVPGQPSQEELDANPLLHRFILVFDREGYSPDFFKEMKQERIACITYHKYPKGQWYEREFASQEVHLVNGEKVMMKLAERGVCLSNGLWVREIRKHTKSGHQTSILATEYISDLMPISSYMFSRWCQENFFRYMREHFNLDRLSEYSLDSIPGPTKLVNPEYRTIDGKTRSKVSILNYKLRKFGALVMEEKIEPKKMEKFQKEKAELQEDIEHLQIEVDALKQKRKMTHRHVCLSELSEELRFQMLSTKSKHFVDTIKMTAYRAETAMAYTLREKISNPDEARSVLRAIYNAEADLLPDEKQKILTVQIHHMANRSSDKAVNHLCAILNETNIQYPGTEMQVVYKLKSGP